MSQRLSHGCALLVCRSLIQCTSAQSEYSRLVIARPSTQMAAVTRLCSTTMETYRSLSIARKWYNVQELEPVYRRLSHGCALLVCRSLIQCTSAQTRKWYNVQELEPVYRRLSHGCPLLVCRSLIQCTSAQSEYSRLVIARPSTQMAAVTRLCSTTMETYRSLSIARKWYNVQELEPVYRRLSHGCALPLWKLTGGCHTAVLYHYGNLQVTKSSTQMVQRTRTRACLYAAVTRLCSTTMETYRSLSIARKWYNVQELEPVYRRLSLSIARKWYNVQGLEPVYMRLSHGCALPLWKLAACLYAAVTRLCSTTMETCRSLSIARKRYNVQGLEPVYVWLLHGCALQLWKLAGHSSLFMCGCYTAVLYHCGNLQVTKSEHSSTPSRSGHSASKKFLVEFGFPPLKVMAHFLTCQDVVQLTSVLLSPPTCQPSSPIVSCSPAVPVPLIIDSHSTCSCRPAPACLSVLAGENLYLSCYRQNMKS
ncbi:hypothetical protein J6590_078026 [Homalodisca vitripennis]|nr:hypothetical protein J6590_078026 [Homalodisca vitripennis]